MHTHEARGSVNGFHEVNRDARRRGSAYTPLVVIIVIALLAMVGLLYYFLGQLEGMAGRLKKTDGPEAGGGPNIVLISIDSLRADHLHCYGYEKPTSPAIDRLAANGVLFESVYSTTSWTLPSHVSLLTGLPNQVHQVTTHTRSLAPEWPTLAVELKKQGYATAGFYSGPYLHPIFGFDNGFDTYESCIRTDTVFDGYMDPDRTLLTKEQHRIWNQKMNGILGDRSSPAVLKKGLEWLQFHQAGPARAKPFFLFLHFFDVHYDYVPPKEFDRFSKNYKGPINGQNYENHDIYHKDMAAADLERVISLYDGEILWVDHHVEQLMAYLEKKKLTKDTIIVLTSDHGEEFFEHGAKAHRNLNGLFAEVIEVPLILHYPPKLAKGRRVKSRLRLIDVMPTLLDLAGIPIPMAVMGKTMKPYASKGPDAYPSDLRRDRMALSELTFLTPKVFAAVDTPDTNDRILSLRDNGFHLTYFPGTERTLLFDMDNDPDEKADLSKTSPKLVERMLEALKRQDEALLKSGSSVKSKGVLDLDPELMKQLEELGYMK